jgi:hypothetical protein
VYDLAGKVVFTGQITYTATKFPASTAGSDSASVDARSD